MVNAQISRIFREIASILEIKGENLFRVRAYERAAQNIEGLSDDLKVLSADNRLREVPGIGKDLAEKIQEFLQSGRIKAYEELKRSIPAGLLEILDIPSLGPKTARLLYERVKIKDIASLQKAISQGRLEGIFGIKEKKVENILKGIELLRKSKERMTLFQARQVAEEFISRLSQIPQVKRISPAGSLRRQKETVRDIDLLVASDKPTGISEYFSRLPMVKEIIALGQTKATVRTAAGIQVDCRVVEEKSFGAALLYFTGAKNFNIKLRQLAIKAGLKINEYGIFKGNRWLSGKTELDLFRTLGLPYIEAELREDTGEIEAARQRRLPRLIELKDICGDLHVHSAWSDGKNSMPEIAQECLRRSYSYVAISDHSQGLRVAGGLSPEQLKQKKKEIEKINHRLKGLRLLYAAEVEIDSRGHLDYKDDLLKEFDLVIAAIHSGFKQSKEQLTSRIIRACQNKYVHIIAHPTGRLFGQREAYEIDFDEVLRACADTNTRLEINAFPERMDLNDLYCRQAKEKKVQLAINTDAHRLEQLDALSLGLAVARRGWLEKKDVLNTFALDDLLRAIRK